jgi:hypothetical protein
MHRTAHAITIGLSLALSLGAVVALAAAAATPSKRPPAQAPGGARPDTQPKQIDKPERGFSLTSSAGWFERSDDLPSQVAVQLIYTLLPPGQRDAPTFRVYVRSQPAGRTLEQTVEAWKKLAAHDQPATYQKPQDTELDGLKAVALRGEGKIEGRAVVDRTVIAIRGSQAYVLHTESPKNVADRAIQSAVAMEKTWKWRGEVPAAPPAVAAGSTKPASGDPDTAAAMAAASAGKALFDGTKDGFRLAYPKT